MKTFKIVIRESNFYVKEIKAKDWLEAKKKTEETIWHDRYSDWGIAWVDRDVYEVEEIKEI
jgi:hypothetical protein